MLPSQTGRPKSSRSHMYRRPKRKRLPIIIVSVIVLVGAAFIVKRFVGSSKAAAVINAANGPNAASPTAGPKAPDSNSIVQVASKSPPAAAARSEQPPLATKPPKKSNAPIGADAPTPPLPLFEYHPPSPVAAAATQPAAAQAPAASDAKSKPGSAGMGTPHPPAPATTAPSNVNRTTNQVASQRMQTGLDLLAQNKPIEARTMLTTALDSPGISPDDAEKIRNELSKLNQRLVFGREIVPGDPFAQSYTIAPGDLLVRLPRKLDLHTESAFIKRINNIADERRIQAGQHIKVIKGPFHAVVVKPDFRLDLYMGDGEQRVYVRSFRVGLGEQNATPEGQFVVKPGSKMVNPAWRNPRTGEFFEANDPKNPLGEYWIGLVGVSDNIRGLEGYGIHGTTDPDSVGKLKSMGCVRMLADDIELLYELLVDNGSTIEIRGPDWP